MNWLGAKAERDAWGKALLDAGVKLKTIKDWTLDPQVTYGPKLSPVTKSIWDTLEDMDSQECLDKCAEVAAWRPLRKPKFGKVNKLNPNSKGQNLYLKVVKGAQDIDGTEAKEVLAGDDTGVVVLSLREAPHLSACTVGSLLRVQNSHIKMIKGYIRLVVDKWGVVKADVDAATAGFETVDEKNNVSATEYELVDK
jgi:replication factor A1